MIPGWDVGIGTMRKTELARFIVKPEYAFGKMGCPPRIPPDATSEWVCLVWVILSPSHV